MELRHFSEAIRCFTEAIELFNGKGFKKAKSSDLYFRRSQAVFYNKFASLEMLQIAKGDIEEACAIEADVDIYKISLQQINELIETTITEKATKVNSKYQL